ncbi:hypothetical protein O181_064713 [Austropuccinia psidii MF-1]|uniref:Uncharacterized protein n=1 Tax=Austropuccinia psidii MF-1 TaxID=1389203 RepID=A0A9Q3EU21_9BASI|nr:hypothetical protein [Austropuccinia psidii MF-1]
MNSIPFCAACKKNIQLKPSPSLDEDFQHTTASPARVPDETNSRNELPAPEASTSPITPSLKLNHLTADTNWPAPSHVIVEKQPYNHVQSLAKTVASTSTTVDNVTSP